MRELSSLLEMEKNNSIYKGKSVKELLKNSCIHFVPMANPDGVSLVQDGINGIGSEELRAAVLEMAKKENVTNLSSYFRLWKNNLRGVNLNKNFDANWNQTVDKKGYPSKDEYKGSFAESEIESQKGEFYLYHKLSYARGSDLLVFWGRELCGRGKKACENGKQ